MNVSSENCNGHMANILILSLPGIFILLHIGNKYYLNLLSIYKYFKKNAAPNGILGA